MQTKKNIKFLNRANEAAAYLVELDNKENKPWYSMEEDFSKEIKNWSESEWDY